MDAAHAQASLVEHRAAAERAEAATLWDDAAREYEDCLALVAAAGATPDDEAALLTALGRCYSFDGQPRAAWRTLRRAIALCRERGDAAGMARATAEVLRIWGPPDRQRAMADEALEALGDAEPYLRALLLLRTGRPDEALRIADRHGFPDILAFRIRQASWRALDEGRVEDAVAHARRSHEAYAALGIYDVAAGSLRGTAFALLQLGRLGDGIALAEDALAYALGVHLRFDAQLPLMDLAGAAFARCEFDRCDALLAQAPGESDFRADLYRMWMALHRGDIDGALRLLVEPERGGGAPTAISQIHAAAAGMLFAAGRHDAARRELEEWAAVARTWNSFTEEAPAPLDCLVELGDEALVREVQDAIAAWDRRRPLRDHYATLQGRGLDAVRGALALRLGQLDEAAAHFHEAAAWADAEGCPTEAGRAALGFGDVEARRGRREEALAHFVHAAARFERCGAAYELGRAQARISSAS